MEVKIGTDTACMCLCMHVSCISCMYSMNFLFYKITLFIFLNGLVRGPGSPRSAIGQNASGDCNLKRADSNYYVIILFIRSHEARLSSVPPKLELWGGRSTLLSPSQNFGGDSPSLSPHDLRHCSYLPPPFKLLN